jgi:hypothetical protein
MKQSGIINTFSSPYHHNLKGPAERAVQTFKSCIKKSEGSIENQIIDFLSRYRITPHSTTQL